MSTSAISTGRDAIVVQTASLEGLRGFGGPRTQIVKGNWGRRVVLFCGRTFLSMLPSTWLLFDLCILVFAVQVAYACFPTYEMSGTHPIASWQASAIFTFAVIISSFMFGLYERETLSGRSRALTRMLATVFVAAIIAYAIIYVAMYSTVSRRTAVMALSTFFVGGSLVRLIALWSMGQVHRGLLVVGTRGLFSSFQRAQQNGLLSEYDLIGYATVAGEASGAKDDPKYLGLVEDQIQHLARHRITDVVIGSDAAEDPRLMAWMGPTLQSGCRVTNEATFYEKSTGQILVDELTPYWFLFADLKVYCDQHATLKRLVDLIAAGIGLVLSAPLWPMIGLAIKLADRGPIFYSQDRVGQNGRIFRLFKFRTMRTDAENGKSVWASPNDPRVTRVGRILRRSRLDELPQLYNILIGDMSIVGPRPERPDLVEELSRRVPYFAERHLVKPGLTGWAQINFHYGSSVEDAKRKLQFDLFYLKHMSFELDAVIILRTIGTFLRGGC